MAIADMQKVYIAVHKSVSDELVNQIQRLGCCQFIAMDQEKADEKSTAPLRSRLRRTEDLLGEVRFAARFIEPYVTEKTGAVARAMGDAPVCSIGELAVLASEETFEKAASEVRVLEKRLSDAKARISTVRGLIAQILPLSELPFPLDLYSKGTDKVVASLFSLPKTQANQFQSALMDILGDMADISLMPAADKDASQMLSVAYARDRLSEVQDILSQHSAVKIDVPPQLGGNVSDVLASLNKELEEQQLVELSVVEEITGIANEVYKTCQYCMDYWGIEKARLESMISGEQTEQIVMLGFWVPKDSCLEALRKILSPYEDLMEVVYAEPDEDEKPPTLLKNKKIPSAVEPLITMYGTPTYGGFDPTSVVTPFFYLFFGMCFGDAGYGLVISGLLIFLMMRKRITGTLKKFLVILTAGNLMAVVVGLLTFSWFGDSITSFKIAPLSFLERFQILDPMNDPMTFLYLSLTLGFIQIMVGLFIAMWQNIRNGDTFAAFADQGGWVISLCGLVLLGLSSAGAIGLPANISGMIAAAGAIILVATQGRQKKNVFGKLFSGVMSLYNVTGYLGDILSYSRLLALGLGSAAVGMVINLLVGLIYGGIPIKPLAIVAAALVFVLGHTFSIAVNLLGAFVHALRLQYVEFFGKFYEGSGEDFAPLSMTTQYVKLTD